jgi:hypothetical protein
VLAVAPPVFDAAPPAFDVPPVPDAAPPVPAPPLDGVPPFEDAPPAVVPAVPPAFVPEPPAFGAAPVAALPPMAPAAPLPASRAPFPFADVPDELHALARIADASTAHRCIARRYLSVGSASKARLGMAQVLANAREALTLLRRDAGALR